MARAAFLVVFAALLAIAAATDFHGSGLTLKVDAHGQQCFYEDIERENTKVFFSFQVTAGGALDIDAWIDGPNLPEIWKAERVDEGRVLFKAPHKGTYTFCFDNRMSTVTGKTIQFNLASGDPIEGEVKLGLGPLKFTTVKRPDPIERSIVRIAEGLREIRAEQDYLRTRERVHRSTVESTNTRVLMWSVVEGVLIVLSSVLQVWYLRHCFEVKRQV